MIKNITNYLISRFFIYSGFVCIGFAFYNIWGRSISSKEFYKEMATQGKILYEDITLAVLLIAGLFLYSIGMDINRDNT